MHCTMRTPNFNSVSTVKSSDSTDLNSLSRGHESRSCHAQISSLSVLRTRAQRRTSVPALGSYDPLCKGFIETLSPPSLFLPVPDIWHFWDLALEVKSIIRPVRVPRRARTVRCGVIRTSACVARSSLWMEAHKENGRSLSVSQKKENGPFLVFLHLPNLAKLTEENLRRFCTAKWNAFFLCETAKRFVSR